MPEKNFQTLATLLHSEKAGVLQPLTRGLVRLSGAVLMATLLVLSESWPVDAVRFLSIVALSIVASLMLRTHLVSLFPDKTVRTRHERVVWLTCLLAVLGVQVGLLAVQGGGNPDTDYLVLASLAAQAMLLSALLGPSIGVVGLTLSVLLLAVPGVLGSELFIAGWLSGAVATQVVHPMKRRGDLIRAMSVLIVAQAVIALSLNMLQGAPSFDTARAMLWAAVAAVVAASIFWLGVVVLEKLSGIVSDWSLLELSAPDHPLLRELNLKAPGTYAHSVRVGTLGEEAARSVGANALLVRTMALYHDVGKTVRPNFFVENQYGSNVHDDLSPTLSAQIVSAHVTDGVQLARDHKLPQTIIDGIQQHHGTSLITYFYYRAIESGTIEPVEEKFRYLGPKPQSKETAILHLADMVEAASRTFHRDDDLETAVAALIEKTRADGQLDESELTFRDLGKVTQAFVRSLKAMGHERVAYPGQDNYAPANEPSSDRPEPRPETPRL